MPPLLVANKFVTKCKEKANLFNIYFLLQCKPLLNGSILPNFTPVTDTKLETFQITSESILNLINELNANKAHGADQIYVQMIKLCGNSICLPLNIIYNNIIDKGIFLINGKWRTLPLFIKRIINRRSKIIDQYPSYPYLLKSLKELFFTDYIIILSRITL